MSYEVGYEQAGEAGPVIDHEYLLDTYGLGPQETEMVVTWGSYTGTVAGMLADEKCPVGNMLADAYQAGGIDEVQTKLSLFGQMDSRFSVEIGGATRAFHDGNLQREEVLSTARTERPDFLA